MKDNYIGLFDSGIGGASVLIELLKEMSNEKYLYLSDSLNNPYGDKTDEELLNICKKNVKYLVSKNCKAIVIACNTASVRVADILREENKKVPIFAIEPAYKMVYDYDYNKSTLIMATKGTIESEKFKKLYNKYDNHKTYVLPCVGLADIIEEGNKEKVKDYLKENISKYEGLVDDVVIGCTHYAFIQDEIKEVLGDVKFYYGASGVAKHVKEVLEEKGLLADKDNAGKIEFVDTSNSKLKEERFYNFLNY